MKASIKTSGPLSENASYKIVALLITLILWVIILGSKEAAIVKMIPANYILPKDMAIANSVPTEVAFRLTGPRLPLKRYSEINDPLTIDLSSASEGFSTIRVHPDSIDVPREIRVVSVSPSTITPRLERLVSRDVPIELNLKGHLPQGLKLISVKLDPPTWSLMGVRSRVENIKKIKTVAVDLSQIHSTTTQDINLSFDESDLIKSSDTKEAKDSKVQLTINVK